MCGICGIIEDSGNPETNAGLIRKMCDAIRHRGPDDEGVYVGKLNPCAVLGHRRLSIIDLSASGRQPLSNEDGTIWIVFNGEIYNYHELRSQLEELGHIFRSHTDTETVVHLYEEYGEDCVKYLRGMFAFAIWYERKKMLLLARDRVGKKPMLYHHSSGTFSFASEFTALLESGRVKKDINYAAIHYYLTFGYIPSPLTIYNDVFKLPPAHILIFKNGKVDLKRYWSLDYLPKVNISEKEAADEVLRLLEEAVRIRLYSDVPLGAFLSGGIDSSIVVALMSRLSGKRVKTFCIGFEESDYSELKFARNIATRYNTNHTEFIVKPNAAEILPLLVERYGEPYADSSAIPTYYVSNETRKYVTVALNGDGGDENFAGYERYQAMMAAELFRKLPGICKTAISGAFSILPDSINSKNRIRNIKRFFQAANMPAQDRYIRWLGVFDNNFKNSLYSDDFKTKVAGKDPARFMEPYLKNLEEPGLPDRLLMADANIYLPDDLLVKVDIASMANSLEARSPFLDHKLMEFAATLPGEYKIKGFIKKYILRKAIKDLVPSENVNRRKMGFGVPIGSWFRKELKPLVCDALLSERSLNRGYFKPDVVREIVNKHIEKKADYAYQLWTLLMLELWHRRFIDR